MLVLPPCPTRIAMACSCHSACSTNSDPTAPDPGASALADPRWRRALWIALGVNLTMFGVELLAGLASGSVSLLADAVDFAGDAANYGLSLAVLSMAVVWRSRSALIKGMTMAGYGVFVLVKTAWALHLGTLPEASTMGLVGFIALLANGGVAWMLYAWRQGDANMRSVWLCSRNDALSNLAVMGAAGAVAYTGSAWPDWAVAVVMAGLALSAGVSVWRQARAEMNLHAHPRQSQPA